MHCLVLLCTDWDPFYDSILTTSLVHSAYFKGSTGRGWKTSSLYGSWPWWPSWLFATTLPFSCRRDFPWAIVTLAGYPRTVVSWPCAHRRSAGAFRTGTWISQGTPSPRYFCYFSLSLLPLFLRMFHRFCYPCFSSPSLQPTYGYACSAWCWRGGGRTRGVLFSDSRIRYRLSVARSPRVWWAWHRSLAGKCVCIWRPCLLCRL